MMRHLANTHSVTGIAGVYHRMTFSVIWLGHTDWYSICPLGKKY